MAILFSGDFHANSRGELDIITKEALLDKYGEEMYNAVNYHIILGDGGFLWPNNQVNEKLFNVTLSKRPFPVLCVLGNHEPVYGLKNIREKDIGLGENVLVINDNPFTAYLKRGKIYKIDKIKFLVLGGALSIDRFRRTENFSWWKEEYWSCQEKKDLFDLLETSNSFDCVISHTGPLHINEELFHSSVSVYATNSHEKIHDEVAKLNDEIHNKIKFKKWLCGHYHEDVYHCSQNPKHEYRYMYRTTTIMEKTENRLIMY